MLEEYLDEDGDEHLQTLQDCATNAIELTATARNLSDVLLEQNVETVSVDLQSVIQDEVESVRSAFPNAVVEIEGSIPSTAVQGDEMLETVFRNLLKNAVQHNDKEVAEISITAHGEDDVVRIEIADNGPGVPDTLKEDVFGKGEMGLDSSGSGLGLYLVKMVVDRSNGEVWVEDNDPEGSVFNIELPKSS